MKKRMGKILCLLLAVAILMPPVSADADANPAEPLPTALEAPSIILYDDGSRNSYLEVKAQAPESVMDYYEKAVVNTYNADESGGDTNNYYTWSDYGPYYGMQTGIQLDYKVDDGEWHYDSGWDTNLYSSSGYNTFNGSYATTVSLASCSSYGNYGVALDLENLGCLKETTDGSTTYYRFDQENHKITVRARYYAVVIDHEYNSTYILSPWSETASLGNGEKNVSSAPTDLGKSTIKNLRIDPEDDYYGAPIGKFDILPDRKVIEAMQWSEQYDEALEDSEIYLVVETSLDPNFGAGSVVYKYKIWESSSLKRWQTYTTMFYDLWGELPDKDQSAFNWNGETIYLRTKYVNERTVSGNDSTIESEYSNVLSLKGEVIKKYDITITHGSYGFDSEGYYSESYSETEGEELRGVDCAPLEGCYVDKVTVNEKVMYDRDDESTHQLLDWYYDYETFYFLEGEDIATEDLNIEITYAGTPTAKYGITTECGTGGYLDTDINYVSWNDNSLVVYHSTVPTITIHPYGGYEIEKVVVDGVENAEAKENASYTFPAITDSTHSIEVTFKRVAYEVSSYVYHGTITSDYEGYSSSNDYVKIGDDITFTFKPAQDGDGKYYEIEKVYIDYVLNEEAKNAGTYTFENVQANHNISVYYSEDPVVTHDITATSGLNGKISPEGVIHAREGSTRRFDFIPDEGYEVDKVLVDGVEVTNLATKEYYNISDIMEAHRIHVTFKKMPVQYDINVIVSGSNPTVHTVNPAGVTPVWEGEDFTVTYTPFAGYEVEKVLVDGVAADKDGTYSLANIDADHTIEIFFKIKSYTVTFVDYDNKVLKTETVNHGEKATPPQNPTREHYVFTGWDTTYNDVTTNVTVKAMYEPEEYQVKFIGWDGKILKTQTVEYATDATAPNPPDRVGYDFSHWNKDYTQVESDLEVTAVYTPKEYTVKFVDSDGKNISTQTVKYGNAAVVPADPAKEGYTFIGWDNLGYGNVTSDMTVTAQYVEGNKTVYTVTATAHGSYGTVSPVGITKIMEDGSVTVNFYPDEFSKIVKVVVDGVEVELNNFYSFTNVKGNHTVDVYFAPTATIHVKDDEIKNGTVTGHYELLDDQMVYVLDITPEEGYEIDRIYVNGTAVEAEYIGGRYILRDVSKDMDIKVSFKEIGPAGGENMNAGTGTEDSEKGEGYAPETGDNTNIFLWITLLVLGTTGIIIFRRKKSKV